MDLKDVQKIVGHATPKMTKVYAEEIERHDQKAA